MKRLLVTMLVAGGALVQAAVASAGCWATAGLAPPPEGTSARRHLGGASHDPPARPHSAAGRADARPSVTITNAATGEERTFTAFPSSDPTVYEAAVVFPSAGSWRYEVFDGFTTWNGEPAPVRADAQIRGGGDRQRGAARRRE